MDWWIWLIIAIAILSLVSKSSFIQVFAWERKRQNSKTVVLVVGLIVGRTRTQKHQILDETSPFDDEDDLKGDIYLLTKMR